jgi:hypothetical protein
MAEEPIKVRQGVYKMDKNPQNIGVCVVIDDRNTWNIKIASDGSTIITIPADSKWLVTTEETPDGKKKAVIFRKDGRLVKEGPFKDQAEISVAYEHPAD